MKFCPFRILGFGWCMKVNMANVLVAGGGIGGLSAALACARAGHRVSVHERAQEVTEVGAGVQLGPNVVKILYNWGLQEALGAVAAFPEQLTVRNAMSGNKLGVLRFGQSFAQRYGAPYLTIHRADLHSVLQNAATHHAHIELHMDSALVGVQQTNEGVTADFAHDQRGQGDLLVGADGGWSMVRKLIWQDGTPQPTGHLAYRSMVRQSELPERLRSSHVTAWLGPQMHVVQYPVRRGAWLNVVAIVHGQVKGDMTHWDHSANARDIQHSLNEACVLLRDLVAAVPHWRLWPLSIRPPMQGPNAHAMGRIALLGDAAHPMVPYLAQGAGMAIEDASALVWALGGEPQGVGKDMASKLKAFANARWQRNAQVQARAIKNGEIFHASGFVRWGRDTALRVLGDKLLDMPWLYGGKAHP
jgi:salicylate hydroxylase